MAHEEKRAWILLLVSIGSYAVYAAVVLGRADGRSLAHVPYAAVLLWTVGVSILASIVVETALGVVNPRAARTKDVRDKEISRLGEYIGQSFVVIGAVAAMLMAMADWDRFWIANVIYLCFTLSAILGSIAKIGLYHGSFPRW